MFRSLTLIAATLAVATAAHAEERVFKASVTVALIGKSPAQIARDIRRAAADACYAASLKAGAARITSDAECRTQAIRKAEAFVRDHQIAEGPPASRVASAN